MHFIFYPKEINSYATIKMLEKWKLGGVYSEYYSKIKNYKSEVNQALSLNTYSNFCNLGSHKLLYYSIKISTQLEHLSKVFLKIMA
jgi:uncharacterized phage-associated protein